jgi:septum formation topological specificity factor MinE
MLSNSALKQIEKDNVKVIKKEVERDTLNFQMEEQHRLSVEKRKQKEISEVYLHKMS